VAGYFSSVSEHNFARASSEADWLELEEGTRGIPAAWRRFLLLGILCITRLVVVSGTVIKYVKVRKYPVACLSR
jgi:hypothetical protein